MLCPSMVASEKELHFANTEGPIQSELDNGLYITTVSQ